MMTIFLVVRKFDNFLNIIVNTAFININGCTLNKPTKWNFISNYKYKMKMRYYLIYNYKLSYWINY